MEIQPLCPELIAKLEIAVAHRNCERAVAVIERHFERLGKPKPTGVDTPLADLLHMRQASILARNGYISVADLNRTTKNELLNKKGIGHKLINELREKLRLSLRDSTKLR